MSYSPNPGAQPDALAFVQFLSQRDVSIKTPINYLTFPGTALTAACFGNGYFDEDPAATCLSNLLLLHFRRLVVDLYWDASRDQWNLCPVQLGEEVLSNATTRTTSIHASRTSTSVVASTAAAEPPGSTTSNSTVITTNATGIQIGPYWCSYSLDFTTVTNVVSEYFKDTDTNLNASSLVMTLNLHAAASKNDPLGSAQAPPAESLPSNNSRLSDIVDDYLSQYLYDPSELSSQRGNLNASQSWFSVYKSDQPNTEFYTLIDQDGHTSTPDGWPDLLFVELQNAQRVLVEFGTIDPQMSGYNITDDADTIFAPEYLSSARDVTFQSDGNVSAGCFLDASSTATVAQENSSWAVTSIGDGGRSSTGSFSSLFSQARSLTACGISSVLNATLNTTADVNYMPYQAYIQNGRWSWAESQPQNTSLSDWQCAVLNATSGFWEVADCQRQYFAACHNNSQPYDWRISDAKASYNASDDACEEGYSFDAPHSSLENAYLLSTWRQRLTVSEDSAGPTLWINFNEEDLDDCWVVGENSTCPYSDAGDDDNTTRELAVPSVAGVIVFILVTLTLLVKCAGNRRNVRTKRRRGEAGWDYEGVPS